MTLNEFLAISNLDALMITVDDKNGNVIDDEYFSYSDFPSWEYPLLNKNQRDRQKAYKQFVKKYGSFEIVRITQSFSSSINLYLMESTDR